MIGDPVLDSRLRGNDVLSYIAVCLEQLEIFSGRF